MSTYVPPETVREAIRLLDELEPEAIRCKFREAGITGRPHSSLCCILARYLDQTVGEKVRVDYTCFDQTVSLSPVYAALTPWRVEAPNLHYFLKCFDTKVYPELITKQETCPTLTTI